MANNALKFNATVTAGQTHEVFRLNPNIATSNAFVLNNLGFTDATVQFTSALAPSQVNERQTLAITGSTLGGTFTVGFDGQTTAPLTLVGLTAVALQTALEGLSTIGTGNVRVAGSDATNSGCSFVIYFRNARGGLAQALVVSTITGLTGTSPATTVTRNLAGGSQSFAGVTPDGYGSATITIRARDRVSVSFGTDSDSMNALQSSFRIVGLTGGPVQVDSNLFGEYSIRQV